MIVRGQELPEARENRGRFMFNLGPFKLNRRSRKVDQLQAYQNWIAACVNVISKDVRQSRHMLGTVTGPGPTDFDRSEDPIPEVLRIPSRGVTFGHMLELMMKHLDLTGESFLWLLTAGGRPGGDVVGIQSISPNFITEPIYNETERRFTHWRFNNGVADMKLPFEDTIWTRYPHPLEDWRGASPVEQVALSYDMDLFAKAYGTQVLEGGGLPPGILSLDQDVKPKDAAILRQRWKQQRLDDPEAIGVLGKGAKFERTGETMKDLEFLNMSRMNRDQVLAIYGVPAAKLGLVEDVNRANADSVNREYARNVLKPRLNLIAESMNTWLLPRIPEVADGLEFRFEDPIQPDREFNMKRAGEGFAKGVITVDEYRTETGRDPLDKNGEIYKRVGTFRDVLEAEEPPAPPPRQVGQPDPNAKPGKQDDKDPERALLVELVKTLVAGYRELVIANPDATIDDVNRNQREAIEGFFTEIDPQIHSTDDIIKAMRARSLIPVDLPMSQRQLDDGSERFIAAQGALERAMRAELRKLWAHEKAQIVKRIRSLKKPPKIESRMVTGCPELADWFELLEHEDKSSNVLWRDHRCIVIDGLLDGSDIQRDLLDVIFGRQEKSWLKMYRDFFMRGFERGWDLLKRDTGRPLLEFERVRLEVEASAVSEAVDKLASIRETSRRRVGSIVAAAVAEKFAVAKIADAVARLYDSFRGERSSVVARTETAQYLNRGKQLHEFQANQVLGTKIRNTWTTVQDERVRAAHAGAHGQVRFLGTPFMVGGEELDHPHDPDGSAGNVINCRCTLVSEFIDPK